MDGWLTAHKKPAEGVAKPDKSNKPLNLTMGPCRRRIEQMRTILKGHNKKAETGKREAKQEAEEEVRPSQKEPKLELLQSSSNDKEDEDDDLPKNKEEKAEATSSSFNWWEKNWEEQEEECSSEMAQEEKIRQMKRRIEIANIRKSMASSEIAMPPKRSITPTRKSKRLNLPKTPEHHWKLELSDSENSNGSPPAKSKKIERR